MWVPRTDRKGSGGVTNQGRKEVVKKRGRGESSESIISRKTISSKIMDALYRAMLQLGRRCDDER